MEVKQRRDTHRFGLRSNVGIAQNFGKSVQIVDTEHDGSVKMIT